MYEADELEILKSALEGDIIRQKNFLKEMDESGGSDIRFEIWLCDTEILHKKISLQLMDARLKESLDKNKK